MFFLFYLTLYHLLIFLHHAQFSNISLCLMYSICLFLYHHLFCIFHEIFCKYFLCKFWQSFPFFTSSTPLINIPSSLLLFIFYIMQSLLFVIYNCFFFIIFISLYNPHYIIYLIRSSMVVIFVNLETMFYLFHYLNIICESFFIIIFVVFFTTKQSYLVIMYYCVFYIIIHILFYVSFDFLSLISKFFNCCSYIFNSCVLFYLYINIFAMSSRIFGKFLKNELENLKSSCS